MEFPFTSPHITGIKGDGVIPLIQVYAADKYLQLSRPGVCAGKNVLCPDVEKKDTVETTSYLMRG